MQAGSQLCIAVWTQSRPGYFFPFPEPDWLSLPMNSLDWCSWSEVALMHLAAQPGSVNMRLRGRRRVNIGHLPILWHQLTLRTNLTHKLCKDVGLVCFHMSSWVKRVTTVMLEMVWNLIFDVNTQDRIDLECHTGLACASCHMVTVSNPPSSVFTGELILKGQFTSKSCFCYSH